MHIMLKEACQEERVRAYIRHVYKTHLPFVLPFYHEQILQPQNNLHLNTDYKERITQNTDAMFFHTILYFLFDNTNNSFIDGLIKVRKILKILWSLFQSTSAVRKSF